MAPPAIPQRQLNLGPAGWFRAEPRATPNNQVDIRVGFALEGGYSIVDKSAAAQTSGAFGVVSAGTKQRYDLVYADSAGAVQILAGTERTLGDPAYQGAPGWTGTNPGPDLPDMCFPIAWVKVTEAAGVVISEADITQISGFARINRDLDGYFIDKGLVGSVPAGGTSNVSARFTGGNDETPGASATAPFTRGIITTGSLNLVHLVDQKYDEIIHAATGARIFGRLTEAADVWTLTYKYIDAAGAEQTVGNMQTDTTLVAGLTDIRLLGTPKIYSRHDPARPMFSSPNAQISDQVAADIPSATTTLAGKVLAARAAGDKAGALSRIQNVGVTLGAGTFHTLNFLGGGVTDSGGGVAAVPSVDRRVKIFLVGTLTKGGTETYATGALGFTPGLAIFLAAGKVGADNYSGMSMGFATGTGTTAGVAAQVVAAGTVVESNAGGTNAPIAVNAAAGNNLEVTAFAAGGVTIAIAGAGWGAGDGFANGVLIVFEAP